MAGITKIREWECERVDGQKSGEVLRSLRSNHQYFQSASRIAPFTHLDREDLVNKVDIVDVSVATVTASASALPPLSPAKGETHLEIGRAHV